MLDSPSAPRASEPGGPLPIGIAPSTVTLRDRTTTATILPFSAPNQVPPTLLSYLCSQLGREIEKGNTYPMISPLPLSSFGPYWFGVFGAIMLLGEIADGRELHERAQQGCDWERLCLGSFYIKPNYPGRSSHVCNGGFLVTDASRNRGVGRLMGEAYLDWAPKLGYTYSMFNLVYETNVASCRLWDALGFKRIGRVKGCGDLKSHPGELIDAIIYGRDLGQDDELVSEERFDKIRFYLKTGTYPAGADRAEKSRLRSAATHYKLTPATDAEEEKLWLKGKEVISDVNRQVEIATEVHRASHGGINKTTAAIAEAWHWVRIKETVGKVIRECGECGEMNRGLSAVRSQTRGSASASMSTGTAIGTGTSAPQSVGAGQQYSPPAPASSTGHDQTHASRRNSPPSQPSDDTHLLQPAHSYPSYSNDYPLNMPMPISIPMDIDLPLDPALLHSRVPSPFLSASASSHTNTNRVQVEHTRNVTINTHIYIPNAGTNRENN